VSLAAPPKGIEDILLADNLITAEQLSSFKTEATSSGKDIEALILESGLVTSKDLARSRGKLFNVPYNEIGGAQISSEVLDLVPEAIAKKFTLIPYEATDTALKVEMVDPLDLQTIDYLERRVGKKVIPAIGDSNDILRSITEQYGRSIGQEVTEAVEEVGAITKLAESIRDISKVEETIRDAPVARIVSTVLEYAVKIKASDVHIEPQEDKTRIRYRVDGVLQEKLSIPKKVHQSVVARIKILANMKIDEHRLPQDGRFKVQVGETETDLRISTLPSVLGEKVVIRLLKEESRVLTLAELGIRGNALKSLQEALLKSTGIILATGPTGSGKTLTLATCLTRLNTIRVNIITLEDPVEIRVQGVNQVQVNPAIGLTFANGLRSILRQDPNIIMVGEIRDGETASLAVNAALTGHLVLSTLHTNSASGAIPRLLDMGIENFLLASTINVVMAQRLVRMLCPKCKKVTTAPPDEDKELKETLGSLYQGDRAAPAKIYSAAGCDFCDGGYKGRTGIFEVLRMSEQISRLVMGRSSDTDIAKVATAEGMVTMVQDGFLKALEGITTIEEVWRVAKE
jgi:type IV pilus assembly protein PilB